MLESRLPKQKDLVAKLKPNKKELQKMEDAVKEAECDFGAAQANFETAKEAVDEINKKMVEIGKDSDQIILSVTNFQVRNRFQKSDILNAKRVELKGIKSR